MSDNINNHGLHFRWLSMMANRVVSYGDKQREKPLLCLSFVNLSDNPISGKVKEYPLDLDVEMLKDGKIYVVLANLFKPFKADIEDPLICFTFSLGTLESMGYKPCQPCTESGLVEGSLENHLNLIKIFEYLISDKALSINLLCQDLKLLPRSFFVLRQTPTFIEDAIKMWLSKFHCNHCIPEVNDPVDDLVSGAHIAAIFSRIFPKRIPKSEIIAKPSEDEMKKNWDLVNPVLNELNVFNPVGNYHNELLFKCFISDIFYATRQGAKRFVKLDAPPPTPFIMRPPELLLRGMASTPRLIHNENRLPAINVPSTVRVVYQTAKPKKEARPKTADVRRKHNNDIIRVKRESSETSLSKPTFAIEPLKISPPEAVTDEMFSERIEKSEPCVDYTLQRPITADLKAIPPGGSSLNLKESDLVKDKFNYNTDKFVELKRTSSIIELYKCLRKFHPGVFPDGEELETLNDIAKSIELKAIKNIETHLAVSFIKPKDITLVEKAVDLFYQYFMEFVFDLRFLDLSQEASRCSKPEEGFPIIIGTLKMPDLRNCVNVPMNICIDDQSEPYINVDTKSECDTRDTNKHAKSVRNVNLSKNCVTKASKDSANNLAKEAFDKEACSSREPIPKIVLRKSIDTNKLPKLIEKKEGNSPDVKAGNLRIIENASIDGYNISNGDSAQQCNTTAGASVNEINKANTIVEVKGNVEGFSEEAKESVLYNNCPVTLVTKQRPRVRFVGIEDYINKRNASLSYNAKCAQQEVLLHEDAKSDSKNYPKYEQRETKLIPNYPTIYNALKFHCLPGPNYESELLKVLEFLKDYKNERILILVASESLKFKGLYKLVSDYCLKIHGYGPDRVDSGSISAFYKFITGLKQFEEIKIKNFTQTTDCFSLIRQLEPRGW